MEVMQSTEVQLDQRLISTCNDVFDVVCRSGAIKLKQPMTLTSLLNLREEENTRTRLKTETIMEELRNVREETISC